MMSRFFENVPPHIAVALVLALLGILLEAFDAFRRFPATGENLSLMSHLKAQEDETETEAEISEKERKERLADKVRLLRTRITVFSILFSIFGINVEVLAHLVFDVTQSWIQNALITVGPVAFLSYALENLIRSAFDD